MSVDSVYLERLRARDGGPAIEHAYATTTYQARGSTVDRAFVAADPSMDKQELYVATSRSREETWLYATPEIAPQREEIAPVHPRVGLDHIAEAAERDGAQVAAHDAAIRSRLQHLSTAELVARHRELTAYPQDRTVAFAERAVIDHLLSGPERTAATAARLSPPAYVTKTLGERPSDPAKRADWDRAVGAIEGYRLRYGVRDRGSALGERPKPGSQRATMERAQRQIERAQRTLGMERVREAGRSIGREIGR